MPSQTPLRRIIRAFETKPTEVELNFNMNGTSLIRTLIWVIGLSLILSAESLAMQKDAFVISTDRDDKSIELNQSATHLFDSAISVCSTQNQTLHYSGCIQIYNAFELKLQKNEPIENQSHSGPFQNRKSTFDFYIPRLSCF